MATDEINVHNPLMLEFLKYVDIFEIISKKWDIIELGFWITLLSFFFNRHYKLYI